MAPPLLAVPIITAVGRFAAPYLSKELGKLGINKFVSTYGKDAFTSLNETLAADTPMVKADNVPMVNEDNIPMVNPSFKAPGVIAPDAEEMEREAEKIREMAKPIGFPADPPIKPDIKTGETTPPKINTVEEFPAEDKPLPKTPGFAEGDKIDIPIITYYNKDDELIKEGLKTYEEVYSEDDFKTANKNFPELSIENNKKIVDADKHFGARALDKDFDTTRLIYLTPKQYLNLSNDFDENSNWSKARIDYLTEKLKQGKEMGEIPALFVGKEDNNYIVRGHEGRHRASAFLNAGYDKIPVRIQGISREKESDIENKLYTATPNSNVGKQLYSKEFANFIPEKIISERIREDRSLSGEVDFSVELKPTDFYDVVTKEKLFKADDVNTQTEEIQKEFDKEQSNIGNQTKKLLKK